MFVLNSSLIDTSVELDRPPMPLDWHSSRSTPGKRVLDWALGGGLLVLTLPLILVCWLVVRLTSRGPGFYSQLRVGRYGLQYRIYKIRSMHTDCEAATGAVWAKRNDPRVTTVGRVLRKLHLDELPQLWNVIRGDMSLVGPRPERPEFVEMLTKSVPGYADRLAVRPGVTGLAQIQLPPDQDLDSVRVKVDLDRIYLQRCGLWMDLRILFGTGIYLVGFSFARVQALAFLPLNKRYVTSASPILDQSSEDADLSEEQVPCSDLRYRKV